MTHVKRIAAPKTWPIERKGTKFIARPRPKGLPLNLTLPLVVVLRDVLNVADTASHVNKILKTHKVLLNGTQIHHTDTPVGFMDVLTLGKTSYRVSINKNNVLTVTAIKGNTATLQKVSGKTLLHKGKKQLNCRSGYNVLVDKDTYKVGDTIALKDGKITAHYPLKEGATVLITGGSHIGIVGTVKKIDNNTLLVKGEQDIETTKRYAYVIGKEKSEI